MVGTQTTRAPRVQRLVVGSIVVVALGATLLFRVCWGADRSAVMLDDGFAALATALAAPVNDPQRDAGFAAATDLFADASGSAVGASLSILALEMTVRLRGGDRGRLAEPLPSILDALSAAAPERARALLLEWRDRGATGGDRDTYVLLQEFVQRLVEKMSR